MKKYLLPGFMILTACSTSGVLDYHPYLEKKGIRNITGSSFTHCHGYNCRLKSDVSLTEAEWEQIGRFYNAAHTAEEERAAIARSIGQFEKIVGAKTGTAADVAGTYVQLGDGQIDCVDESVNTTVYLDLLTQKNFLKHHDVSMISTRIPIMGGGLGFHQTAVIMERETGERYAVDSWFHDNGHDAEIVSLKSWLHGWRPKKIRENEKND